MRLKQNDSILRDFDAQLRHLQLKWNLLSGDSSIFDEVNPSIADLVEEWLKSGEQFVLSLSQLQRNFWNHYETQAEIYDALIANRRNMDIERQQFTDHYNQEAAKLHQLQKQVHPKLSHILQVYGGIMCLDPCSRGILCILPQTHSDLPGG